MLEDTNSLDAAQIKHIYLVSSQQKNLLILTFSAFIHKIPNWYLEDLKM